MLWGTLDRSEGTSFGELLYITEWEIYGHDKESVTSTGLISRGIVNCKLLQRGARLG